MSHNNDEVSMNDDEEINDREYENNDQKPEKMFTLKKWNAVAMWSWDVECDTCAICRVQVMDACLRCQAENKQDDCVVVWENVITHFIIAACLYGLLNLCGESFTKNNPQKTIQPLRVTNIIIEGMDRTHIMDDFILDVTKAFSLLRHDDPMFKKDPVKHSYLPHSSHL
ncbi:RING-box protein 2 [Caerostris extrusa]|uniref:RING-box protein 2 n=1 Tax=Caerostris extrusa TaxID=172846 RepID=A0AAV4RQJ9_CAEEX|nr:RING-box protein 2 [Caerostris extrusa]